MVRQFLLHFQVWCFTVGLDIECTLRTIKAEKLRIIWVAWSILTRVSVAESARMEEALRREDSLPGVDGSF